MSGPQEQVIDSNATNDVNPEQTKTETPAVTGGQFYVRTITGGALYFSHSETMTIGQIKEDIYTNQGIPVSEQRLIFNAKQLEDNLTLGDYGIGPDSRIDLVLRVRGGI
jgi:hypothetical protein